jgi:pSer/pThr/pTyr-binding forkhead associated (FHA) protein
VNVVTLLTVPVMRTWIIGSSVDCNLVVPKPTVSGRHCRLTEVADGYLLEDLGSSSGTYVNKKRIASATRVSDRDVITLGTTVPMPWPAAGASPGARVIRIGRDADNDIVLDDPRVSGHHARIIISGSQTLIQDLGSSNGTFVNSADREASLATPVTASDVVFLGSLKVPAARLLPAMPAPVQENRSRPSSSKPKSTGVPPAKDTASAPSLFNRWTIALLAQSPIIAILIVLVFGRHAAMAKLVPSGLSLVQGIASTTFALSLAAIWLGGSLAVWSAAAGRSAVRREGSIKAVLRACIRLLVLVALCIVQCAILLAIVHWACGLRGPWLAMLGVLVLASAIALSFGLAVTGLIRYSPAAVGVLLLSFLPMIALGGCFWPLPKFNQAVRMTASVMPSRWAFEGLLLLEPPQDALPNTSAASEPARERDLAEDYVPADSDRMGPEADRTALASMLIGLTSLVALISTRSKFVSGAASKAAG